MMKKSRQAIERNPAAKVRRRRCAIPHTVSVQESVKEKLLALEKTDQAEFVFTDGMTVLKDLLNQYIGRCRIGSKHWPQRVQKQMEWIESKACKPMNEDCRGVNL